MKVGDRVRELQQGYRGLGTVVRHDDHPLGGKVIDVRFDEGSLCTYFSETWLVTID